MSRDIFEYIRETVEHLIELPYTKMFFGGFMVCLQFLFGEMRPAVSAIVVLFCLDFITGFAYAIMKHDVSSERLLRGAVKLLIYGNLLIISHQLTFSGTLLSVSILVTSIIEGYILLTESISITENLNRVALHYKIDLPFLTYIIKVLKTKRDRNKFD